MTTVAKSRGIFVGRREQLAHLIARRKAAGSGHGSIVLVAGEPGIGKTRLLEEFAATLTHGRCRVFWWRCDEFGTANFAPLVQKLEESAPRAMALLVEDAQWASRETLEALVAIGRHIEVTRSLVVVTYRPAEVEVDAERTVLLGKLARLPATTTIDLPPLDQNETRALARSLVVEGNSPGHVVLETIEQRSNGHPLLLLEMLRHATRSTSTHDDPLDFPLSIKGMVAEWLRPFSEADRRILDHGALMREGFTAAEVATLTGASLADSAATLRRSLALRLIVERRDAAGVYAFRQPIVGEILESNFLAHESQALHAKIAHAIESAGGVERRFAELTRHWASAGNNEMAATYAEKAGDRAFSASEFSDAARWYERAAGLTRRAGRTPRDVYEKLADALERSGNILGSQGALRTAAATFEAAGEVERAVRLRLNDALLSQYEADLPAGLSRLDVVTRFAVPVNSQRYAQAVAAFLLTLRHESERAMELLVDFPHDDPEIDPAALLKYFEAKEFAAAQRSDWRTFYQVAEKRLEFARRSGDPAILAETESDFAIMAMHVPDAAADECFKRAIAMAQEHGLARIEAYSRAYAAINDLVRGRLEVARAHLSAALPLAEAMPVVLLARTFAGLLVGRALCDEELIGRCARQELLEMAFGTQMMSYYGRIAGPYAQWLVDHDRTGEAQEVLHRCVTALPNAYGAFLTMPVVASYAAEDDVARARYLLEAAARTPEDRIAQATLLLFGALWESRCENLEASAAFALRAAEAYHSIGWTGMEAWAREVAGERSEALRLYRQCGNLRELRRLELDTNDSAVPSAGAGSLALDSARLLSPRERDIVALVVEGKSNRAIATGLALSEKTVERHLTSIFEKLGLRSRTELAASALAPNRTRR